jgi:hypothetical protein
MTESAIVSVATSTSEAESESAIVIVVEQGGVEEKTTILGWCVYKFKNIFSRLFSSMKW